MKKRTFAIIVAGFFTVSIAYAIRYGYGMLLPEMLMALDLEGICVSTGSACTTGEAEPSHVLMSMGFEREWALGSLRMTLGHLTHPDNIATVLDVLPRVVEQLRNG